MRVPVTTYRLQFTPQFGFADADAVVAYLHELGVTDLYASPIFQARSGSLHGYDIVDPNRLNPELGSEQQFVALIDRARRHDLGWLQDIVPNHMAYDGQNRMLMDVGSTLTEAHRPAGAVWDNLNQEMPALMREMIGPYIASATLLGQRTGELHVALASDHQDPAFSPEKFTPFYLRSLYQSSRTATARALTLLGERLAVLPEDARGGARLLLSQRLHP
jgi:maltooligosyltrehalose synthase